MMEKKKHGEKVNKIFYSEIIKTEVKVYCWWYFREMIERFCAETTDNMSIFKMP